ncbi:hypothetical protein PIB30_071144 [Stylosanthes scabra]|uniref:Uncharacterized protein n=1 Tax=Stylosanthes scabra TaxID=79078 RepID=A0ABU6SQ63_9FABA|nr:hypothetical protein [Stylosanthes scabra]
MSLPLSKNNKNKKLLILMFNIMILLFETHSTRMSLPSSKCLSKNYWIPRTQQHGLNLRSEYTLCVGRVASYVSFCVARQDLAELPRYTSSFHYAKLNYSIVKGEELCSSGTRNMYDLGYDSEPERTLLRRRREARRARHVELEQQLNMEANNEDDLNTDNNRVTLGQYINPTTESCGSTIQRPAIQANNFELKPSLI